ncbi:MAG: hypothetical protein PHF56_03765 [Desulfuromonadaceae bacterium]|nr:hypothetical protein [Desulfuromonadaceae bacterium]
MTLAVNDKIKKSAKRINSLFLLKNNQKCIDTPFSSAIVLLNAVKTPNPDKQDKCVNEVIFCEKRAENNF